MKSVRITAEWVDVKVHDRRVRDAIRKANVDGVKMGSPQLDPKHEFENGYLDYADPENSMLVRKFPSVEMAVGWAKKNCTQALWHSVTAVKSEIDHDDHDSETQLGRWDVQDGEIVFAE